MPQRDRGMGLSHDWAVANGREAIWTTGRWELATLHARNLIQGFSLCQQSRMIEVKFFDNY